MRSLQKLVLTLVGADHVHRNSRSKKYFARDMRGRSRHSSAMILSKYSLNVQQNPAIAEEWVQTLVAVITGLSARVAVMDLSASKY